jgi:DNA oxidative demethylase
MQDLFAHAGIDQPSRQKIAEGAFLLPGRARSDGKALLEAIDAIAAASPFRHMTTPGGFLMSVAMTNCGNVGWVTDRRGYRYQSEDPLSGQPWPAMPALFLRVAAASAGEAGFAGFYPDACLINRYEPGSKMSLHQDKDERDYSNPIVSVSLGLPATFLFGGLQRSDRTQKVPLEHGDVVVWGGPARLSYHGIMPLKDGDHPTIGRARVNLTFRKV